MVLAAIERHGSVTAEDATMQSLSSGVAFGPHVCSERRPMCRGIMDVANKRESSRSMSYSSAITSWSKPAVGISPSPSTPRRRASQGSLQPAWSPASRVLPKETPPLQLPSFESPGISTPIPQKAHPRSLSADHSPQRSALRPGRATVSGPPPVCETVQDTSRGDYATSLPLTPPADDDEHVGWNPRSDAPIFDAHINNREPKPQAHMDESRSRQTSSPSETRDDVYSPTGQKPGGRPPDEDERMAGDAIHDQQSGSWLANSIDATISSLLVSNPRGEAVRIVSQTLPYPRAADRYVRLPTQNAVFGSIVQTIQDRLQPGQSPYINVTHAVPEQFSLSNLPTSPPSTPSHLPQRDDYFNSTVFCSATPVPAYHDFRGTIPSVPFPFPVVPPYSIHISVVERYLPPSSTQEYRDFFSHNRPSILMDRLIELSPNGGSLLLIYPTKRGAMTFKTQYLGPILDPLLRQLVVVNGLSADVGRSLGKLAAVNGMDDFDTMRANLVQLCEKISGPSSRFTVVEAGRGAAFLDRNLWTEWYIQQERSRMKDVLSVYWQNGRSLPGNSPVSSNSLVLADKEVTSAMLLGEILDGIKKRPYGDDIGPREGVELGVFVIRRSH